MSKPLTNEQIWGLPEEQLPKPEKKDFFDLVDVYGNPVVCRFFGIEVTNNVEEGNREKGGPEQ